MASREELQRQVDLLLKQNQQISLEKDEAQREKDEAQREKDEAQREKDEAQREKDEAQREKDEAQRERDKVQRERDEAQRLVRDTTLEEYLDLNQEHVLSQIRLVTDGYLTTKTPATNPAKKHCPTVLKPWTDFLSVQKNVIKLIDEVFPRDERLFESLHFLQTIGSRIHSRKVYGESSLMFIENNAVEDPVRIIMSKFNRFHPERFNLDIPDEVEFQSTASNLRDPDDRREAVLRDAKLRTDQICVFRESALQRDIAYVIEYKAPHKLHTSHLEMGLRFMNIYKEVVNKLKIPTEDPERSQHYAELLTAAAITQTYHYMLEAGLEYGYVANGDAFVFLYIDWSHPDEVQYHLAQPLREVKVNEDPIYSNAVCQVLAFTVLALQSRQHGNDDRVRAANLCEKWEVDFAYLLDQISKEDEERKKASGQESGSEGDGGSSKRKHRRVPSDPDYKPREIKKTRRNPREEEEEEEEEEDEESARPGPSDLRSHRRHGPGGGGGAGGTGGVGEAGGASGAGLGGATAGGAGPGLWWTGLNRSQPTPDNNNQREQRDYCTAACLLSLVDGGPLDSKCPNAALHRCGEEDGQGKSKDKGNGNGKGNGKDQKGKKDGHLISHTQFLELLRKQLSQSLEKGVAVLGKEGSCGALFQITLLQFGYTFVAKGVTGGRVPDLERELAVYQKLRRLQGHGIPVCLGAVDLKPLGQVYFYDFDVRIIQFLLLSHGGGPVLVDDKETIATVRSILFKMHKLGVIHGDVRFPNVLRAPDGQISVIDFDRAILLPNQNNCHVLSSVAPNKRKQLMEDEGFEVPPAKRGPTARRQMELDLANAQSLFTIDCGRFFTWPGKLSKTENETENETKNEMMETKKETKEEDEQVTKG